MCVALLTPRAIATPPACSWKLVWFSRWCVEAPCAGGLCLTVRTHGLCTRAHVHRRYLLLDYILRYGSLLTVAVALAQQGDEMKCGGGVFTPAACQGQLLRQRLESTGSSFQWLDE